MGIGSLQPSAKFESRPDYRALVGDFIRNVMFPISQRHADHFEHDSQNEMSDQLLRDVTKSEGLALRSVDSKEPGADDRT
jgi:hypothetical protein